jgi:hypothetical protein
LIVNQTDPTAATLAEARATNQRLNYRAQRLESELAAYRRAVADWEISDSGTYVPLRSLARIATAAGIKVPERWELHYQRVERADAQLRRLAGEAHDTGTQQPVAYQALLASLEADRAHALESARHPDEPEVACTARGIASGILHAAARVVAAFEGAEAAQAYAEAQQQRETEAGPDRCSGCRYVPCEKCSPAAGETEPNNIVDWSKIERDTAQSGVDTPGCDCGHDGMGPQWHAKNCEWMSIPPCDVCGVRGHSFEDCQQTTAPAPAAQQPAAEAPTLAQLAEADAGYRELLMQRGQELAAEQQPAAADA